MLLFEMKAPLLGPRPVILKLNNFQSLEKALNCFMELEFCNSDVYFLNRRIKCVGGHL